MGRTVTNVNITCGLTHLLVFDGNKIRLSLSNISCYKLRKKTVVQLRIFLVFKILMMKVMLHQIFLVTTTDKDSGIISLAISCNKNKYEDSSATSNFLLQLQVSQSVVTVESSSLLHHSLFNDFNCWP